MGTIEVLTQRIGSLKDEQGFLLTSAQHHEERAKNCYGEIEKVKTEIAEIENDIAVLEDFKNKNRKEDIEK